MSDNTNAALRSLWSGWRDKPTVGPSVSKDGSGLRADERQGAQAG